MEPERKTKRIDEEEQEDGRELKRIKRSEHSVLEMTDEECRNTMREWIHQADARILGMPAQDEDHAWFCVKLTAEKVINGARNYGERYRIARWDDDNTAINEALLTADLALCEAARCPLHVMHTLATIWYSYYKPFGSTCISVMLQCLKRHFPKGYFSLPFLVRVINIGIDECDHRGYNPQRWNTVRTVPVHMRASLAGLLYDLDFLTETAIKSYNTYDAEPLLRPCCQTLFDVKYAFCDLVRGNYFPDERTLTVDCDPLEAGVRPLLETLITAVDEWMKEPTQTPTQAVTFQPLYMARKMVYYPVTRDKFLGLKHGLYDLK